MTDQTDIQLLEKLLDTKTRFFEEIGKSIIGQKDVLDHILIALLCKGHTLIVGVPGLAKTLMIKSMAELLDLNFSRIQFTPDLMPSDITGTEVIEQMNLFLCWQLKIQSNKKEHIHCLKLNLIDSCLIY